MSARHCLLIVNPRAGSQRGLAVLEQARPILERGGFQLRVRVTDYPGHARKIAATVPLGGYDNLSIVGGDGTIHEVVNGLMDRGQPDLIPLGFIPAGTGNTLHQHLQCSDPLEAARRIVAGNPRPLDAVRVTMGSHVVHCVDLIGWGAVADINRTAECLRLLGAIRYAVAALGHVARARRRRARVILDGRVIDDEFLFVVACNPKFTAKGMKMAPRAEIGDGKIDVVLVRQASRVQMLKLLAKVFDGSHVLMDCVEYYQVRSFGIESACQESLNLDGEMKGGTPFHAEVLPAALRVFV